MSSAIYTRGGDRGETSLLAGGRVRKDAQRIECVGSLDELSANLGVARAALRRAEGEAARLADVLMRVQNELMALGSILASAGGTPRPLASFDGAVATLEADIDRWNSQLPELRVFILPGGGPVSAQIHVARTVCRRAERQVCRLAAAEAVDPDVLVYLNRLSDALFVMARRAAQLLGEDEEHRG